MAAIWADATFQHMRGRPLEWNVKSYRAYEGEDIIEKCDGKDKQSGNALLSRVNDGSRFARDDVYWACASGQIDRSFKMMMGYDTAAGPVENIDEVGESVQVVQIRDYI